MAYTEVQTQGFFSRLIQSIRGVLFGLVLFIVAFPLLFWNESRAAKHSMAIGEGRSQVVDIDPMRADKSNEGKLVHAVGQASSTEKMQDRDFGVEVQGALRLRRKVEYYQWRENQTKDKRKKLGGSEESVITYTYEKVWSEENINSSNFKERGYSNNFSRRYRSQTRNASPVNMGVFMLDNSLTEQADAWEKVPVDASTRRGEAQLDQGGLYIGRNPSSPEIGDARIQFDCVRPAQVTVVAQQSSNMLRPFATSKGVAICKLMMGDHNSTVVFDALEKDNTYLTWMLRFIGFFLMVVGLNAIFAPFVVMADVIPVVGDLLGMGGLLFSLLIATPLALGTVAAGWIVARPLIGGGLLLLTIGSLVLVWKVKSSRKSA